MIAHQDWSLAIFFSLPRIILTTFEGTAYQVFKITRLMETKLICVCGRDSKR